MRGLRRKITRYVLVAACFLVIVLLAAPPLVRRIVRRRLQAMIAAQLNAELQIGELSYHFPYGIEAGNAALIAEGPAGRPVELLRIPRLSIQLAQSPFHSGPLVIESISIDRPTIHLIRLRTGLLGRNGVAKSQAEKQGEKHPLKLSDMFRLRRLSITDGRIDYENRALAHSRPLVWNGLNVDLGTAPQSSSEYGFHFVADDAPLASLDVSGRADIDSFLTKLDQLRLTVNVNPGRAESAIPPEYQQIIDATQLRGDLLILTRAVLNPLDLPHSTFDTTVELHNAAARLSSSGTPFDRIFAKLHLTDGAGDPAAELVSLDAVTPSGALHLTRGSLRVDPEAKQWQLDRLTGTLIPQRLVSQQVSGSLDFDLSGKGPLRAKDLRPISATLHILPRGISLRAPGLSEPINQIAETELTLKDGVLSANRLRAAYGEDVWYIKQADVDLSDMPQSLAIHSIDGAITFAARRSAYPSPIEKLLSQLDPSGPWFFSAKGLVSLKDRTKADYEVRVRTARGALKLDDGKLPVYDINTEIVANSAGIEIERFDAGTMGGTVSLAGSAGLGNADGYHLNAQIHGANLNDVSRLIAKPGEKPQQLGGRGNLTIHLDGSLPDNRQKMLDSITGNGELEIRDGDFWQIPVMKSIADNSKARTVLTVGQAAAVFTISHGAVHLKHAAASAPALGVDGHGDIDFKGRLNVDGITTVLGNWGDKFAAGEDVSRAVNQIQQTLNGVTQAAVMNIHVGGTVNQPDIQAVPAPFLSGAMNEFTNFVKAGGQDAGGLLGYVQDTPPPQSGK